MAGFEYQRNQVRAAVGQLYDTCQMYAEKRVKKILKKKDDNFDGQLSIDEIKDQFDEDELEGLDDDNSGTITKDELYDFFDNKSKEFLKRISDDAGDIPKLFKCPTRRLELTLGLSTLGGTAEVKPKLAQCFDDTNVEEVVSCLQPPEDQNGLKSRIKSFFGAINYEADLRADETFKNYDDGSGFLSTEELNNAFENIDFAAIDANGSGFVDYSELRDAMQGQVVNEVRDKKYERDIKTAVNRLAVFNGIEGGDELRARAGDFFAEIIQNEDLDIDAKIEELLGTLSEEDLKTLEEKVAAEEPEADVEVTAPTIAIPERKSGIPNLAGEMSGAADGAAKDATAAVDGAAKDATEAANKAMGELAAGLPGMPKKGGACGCC